MIQLSLPAGLSQRAFHVLCLGCHSDDIEIGCGGAILTLANSFPSAVFHWVVFAASGVRAEEAERSARSFVPPDRLHTLSLHTFRDGFMPFAGAEVKEIFETLKAQIKPDLIFTQNRQDAHQDHRLIAELTWNTFRNHLILEYEIPKYDGDLGQPNLFIPLEQMTYQRKVDNIMRHFATQHSRQWFREEVFLGLMRLRGMECNAASGYAEGFFCRKASLPLIADGFGT